MIDVGTHWKPGAPPAEVRALLEQARSAHHMLRRRLSTRAAYVNFPTRTCSTGSTPTTESTTTAWSP